MFCSSSKLLAVSLLLTASPWFVASTLADDRNPPNVTTTVRTVTWQRTDLQTTSAEWLFNADPFSPDGLHLQPDGTLKVYSGNYAGPGITGPVAEPSAGLSLSAAGGWVNNSNSDATITFTIPDWVDQEPTKLLQIQTRYFAEGSGDPPALALQGYKSSPVSANLVGRFGFEISPYVYYDFEYFTMSPNPDYEQIVMTVQPGYTVSEVVIDTIAVPEPATAGLLLLAGVIGLLRRRR